MILSENCKGKPDFDMKKAFFALRDTF